MAKSFSQYDKRGYLTLKVEEGYKVWAPIYDEIMTDDLDIILLNELRAVPWDKVSVAADLACGTGRTGAWLAEKCHISTIDGIDISQGMLKFAKRKSVYRNLYRKDILGTSLPDNSYDLAISSFAVCHIYELDRFYKEVNRILTSGGYFVLADYHPFFLLNGIPTHFTNMDGNNIAIENYIHLFSDHISEGIKQNLEILEMKERIVTEEWSERVQSMAKYIHMPVSFAMVWKKA